MKDWVSRGRISAPNRRREGPNGKESVARMSLESAMHRKIEQIELPLEFKSGSGEAPTARHVDSALGNRPV